MRFNSADPIFFSFVDFTLCGKFISLFLWHQTEKNKNKQTNKKKKKKREKRKDEKKKCISAQKKELSFLSHCQDTNQLSDDTLFDALDYMNLLLQRQMSYMSEDGAFSMFRDYREPTYSTW